IQAAVAEWLAEPADVIRPDVHQEWRAAIVGAKIDEEYTLGKILASDEQLAFDWLLARIQDPDYSPFQPGTAFLQAVSKLPTSRRGAFPREKVTRKYLQDWFDALMGSDIDLFQQWMAGANENLRLRPLVREVSEKWIRMAQIALDTGATDSQVAEHCTPHAYSPSIEYFERLLAEY